MYPFYVHKIIHIINTIDCRVKNGSYFRSRVVPGKSWTIALRLPTKRLNRVDLPTFGRPMMATCVYLFVKILLRDLVVYGMINTNPCRSHLYNLFVGSDGSWRSELLRC